MARDHGTAEARWRAVAERDGAEADRFVYGVRTTGVYCRPGCSSRRPNRENVVFFETAQEASAAGFRPCCRCAPDRPEAPREPAAMLEAACGLLAGEEGARTAEVAEAVGLSRVHFQRLFKRHLGVTPQAYRRRVLAERARDALPDSGSVTELVYAAGYSSSSRFYEGVGRELGMPPSRARTGGAGEHIRYALGDSSLGRLLVAWTHRGICQVDVGDRDADLLALLERRYPEAERAPAEDDGWVRAVVDAVDGCRSPALPLDMRGTAFQERVWQALRAIPPGTTRTYAQVAEAIGSPRAARAVANACAANPIAVLTPCHRAVRGDGGLGGYRWGLDRKRTLLDREGAPDE